MEPCTFVDKAGATQEMETILRSSAFSKAQRSQRFLRYLVEAALADPPLSVKEYVVALEVFDRGSDYDPNVDATVRVEAGRLRSRLREYYADEGSADRLIIQIPKGRYVAVFLEGPGAADGYDSSEENPGEGLLFEAASYADSALPARFHRSDEPMDETSSVALAKRRIKHPVAYGLTLTMCILCVLAAVLAQRHQQRNVPAIHAMAVLPLDNLSGDADQDYFAAGMTDELTTELAKIPGLRVVSRDSVMREKMAKKSLVQIMRELHVDAVVEGSIVQAGGRIRINARLIDARHDQHLWAGSFEGSASDVLSLQNSVAHEIASRAQLVTLPPVPGHPKPKLEAGALDAYLHGRYFLDKRDSKRSADYFRRAIAIQPTYSAAYAGLADALESQTTLGLAPAFETTPMAIAAAKQAIALDANDGAGYTALGTIAMTETWDWPAAEQNLRRGIELSPNDSFAEVMYALYLDATNQPDSAVQHMLRAVAVDPVSFYSVRSLASSLYYDRKYDLALEQLERARELDPTRSSLVDSWMSWTYEKMGMRDEAVDYDQRYLKHAIPNLDSGRLRQVYQRQGWDAYWRAQLHSLNRSTSNGCQPYSVGVILVRLGETDKALAALRRAADQHCFWMAQLNVDPLLDKVRSDPRFAELKEQIYSEVGNRGISK